MRGAPPGTEVGLYVDTTQRLLVGQIVTTEAGRVYGLVAVRTQATGRHAGTRQHLRAVVLPEMPAGETPALVLRWYRRRARRTRG